MISIIELRKVFETMVSELNKQNKNKISTMFFSPTEEHFVKRLGESKGIVLAVKLPDSDSEIDDENNYNEQNHCLVYLLEKQDPGRVTNEKELNHYAVIQSLMKDIKTYLKEVFAFDKVEYIMMSKQFRTEWEYQVKGGWNGMSLTFDLEDYSL